MTVTPEEWKIIVNETEDYDKRYYGHEVEGGGVNL